MQSYFVSEHDSLADQYSLFADLLVLDQADTLAPLLADGLDQIAERFNPGGDIDHSEEQPNPSDYDDGFPRFPRLNQIDIDVKIFDILAVVNNIYPKYFVSIVVPKYMRKSYQREKRMLNATPVVLLDSPYFPLISCNLSLVDVDGNDLPFSSSNTASKPRGNMTRSFAGINGSIKIAPNLQLATFEPFYVKGIVDQFHFRFKAFDPNNRLLLSLDSPLSTAKSKIGTNLLRKKLLISGLMFAMQIVVGKSVAHVGTDFKLFSSWSPMCVVLLRDLTRQLKEHEIELSPGQFLDIPYSVVHDGITECLKQKKTIRSGDSVVLVDLSSYSVLGPLKILKMERKGICTAPEDICFRDRITFQTPNQDYLSFTTEKDDASDYLGSMIFNPDPYQMQIIEMVEEKREFYNLHLSCSDLTVFPHITGVSVLSELTFVLYGHFSVYCRNFWVFIGNEPVIKIDFYGIAECTCTLFRVPSSNTIYLVSNSSSVVEKLSFPLLNQTSIIHSSS